MDAVEEGHQARRAKEQAQRDQQPAAPVLNRERGRRRTKYHLTSTHVPQNLEDAILDLCRCQLTEQLLKTTQEHREVEAENQRQMEEVQINQEVQMNQIIEEWRNEDADALDYEGQQNRDSNGDLNVDRNMQENILRVVSNISLIVSR